MFTILITIMFLGYEKNRKSVKQNRKFQRYELTWHSRHKLERPQHPDCPGDYGFIRVGHHAAWFK